MNEIYVCGVRKLIIAPKSVELTRVEETDKPYLYDANYISNREFDKVLRKSLMKLNHVAKT